MAPLTAFDKLEMGTVAMYGVQCTLLPELFCKMNLKDEPTEQVIAMTNFMGFIIFSRVAAIWEALKRAEPGKKAGIYRAAGIAWAGCMVANFIRRKIFKPEMFAFNMALQAVMTGALALKAK